MPQGMLGSKRMSSAVSGHAASVTAEELLDVLLERTASGDKIAFRSLYDRTSGRLFAICLRIARNRTLAEDFLQEAYARVWERSTQFDRQRGSALAWMIALARHYAIDVIGRAVARFSPRMGWNSSCRISRRSLPPRRGSIFPRYRGRSPSLTMARDARSCTLIWMG